MPACEEKLPFRQCDAEDLRLIQQAAAEAGKIALQYFGQDPEVWLKNGQSPVSEADLAVDRFLRAFLLKARPDYGWISEETATDEQRTGLPRAFVVDPIDGTRAFLAGDDRWCVSIAVIDQGKPRCGVLDVPARGQVLSAAAGEGAFQNGKPIAARLPPAGKPYPVAMSRAGFDQLPHGFRSKVSFSPYVPSLAYRIAMVGRSDLAGTFVRAGAHDWDLAAADLVLSEAGGHLLTLDGKALRYGQMQGQNVANPFSHDVLIAAAAGFAEEMLAVVRSLMLR
ncbi:3'(2'),5'-bisphosphate nucleotidase CysQ [Pseudochrobactrum sp. HB0163]|uniref:3'(2'),5'-bisphosphate nucleotidase CysQ n=1 Tax=Pseudochrobactrum sp. HB0163 TaxID=3450708 RepID=UPI003F6E27CB